MAENKMTVGVVLCDLCFNVDSAVSQKGIDESFVKAKRDLLAIVEAALDKENSCPACGNYEITVEQSSFPQYQPVFYRCPCGNEELESYMKYRNGFIRKQNTALRQVFGVEDKECAR